MNEYLNEVLRDPSTLVMAAILLILLIMGVTLLLFGR